MVVVKFFATFRDITGDSKIEVNGVSTVNELVNKLAERYGKKFLDAVFEDQKRQKLRETVNILVNGRSIVLMDGLNTKLNDSDSVAIFPPISGGA